MRLVILFTFVLTTLFSNELYKKLDYLIKNKKEKEVVILRYDPFIYQVKKVVKKDKKAFVGTIKSKNTEKKRYNLVTIINKKAFIDGKWYKKGDYLDKYKVVKISYDGVLLKYKNRSLKVGFADSKKIVKIREN